MAHGVETRPQGDDAVHLENVICISSASHCPLVIDSLTELYTNSRARGYTKTDDHPPALRRDHK